MTRRVVAAAGALILALLLIAVVLDPAAPAWAAAGDLDPTFGVGGKVTTDFFGSSDDAAAVAVQGDGKIVVVGGAFNSNGSTSDFALARYNPDGVLDPTFGVGGKVTTDFIGGNDGASAVAIVGAGHIVAAGSASGDFALAQFGPDGTLDSTFGTSGKVTTDFFGSGDGAYAMAIQGNGKIVAAGTAFNSSGSNHFALAGYNPDGTLDPTFGTGGKVTTDFGLDDVATAVAIQSDGHIVAAGLTYTLYTDFALARYNPDGTLDPTFGTGGKVTTDFFGSDDHADAVAVQADGHIVVVGYADTSNGTDFALARYNPDGTLDPTFGSGGKVATDFSGGSDYAFGMAIQADGLILAAGYTNDINFSNGEFALARYNPDGTLDPTFGTGGMVTTDFTGGGDQANAVGLQSDGRIVAAGFTSVGDFALARYEGGASEPAITSVTPGAVGQGATVVATITGSNFQPGATVSVSGPGVTVVSTTFGTATKLKAQIGVAATAPVGPRDVTVTDTGGSATCSGCLVVDAAPQPTSASPGTGALGSTERVAIFGADFQPGAQVRFGKGITVTSTRFLSSSELKASITIAAGAATGSRTVGVVNPDGGKGSCIACFGVT